MSRIVGRILRVDRQNQQSVIWVANEEGLFGPLLVDISRKVPVPGEVIDLRVSRRGSRRDVVKEWVSLWRPPLSSRWAPGGKGWERLLTDPSGWHFLRARGTVLQALRRFFLRRRFAEVETPILSEYETFDPYIKNARVEMNVRGRAWRGFLQTSPEYEMKMLLVAGAKRIFQFFRAVRSGERSRQHNPEFCLLEWYRVGADYRAIMRDLEGLVRISALAVNGALRIVYRGKTIRLDQNFRITPFFDALHKATGVREKMARTMDGLRRAVGDEVPPFPGERWSDYVMRVFALKVQPKLGQTRPEFVVDYPAELGTMARPRFDRPDLYERVELFIAGTELANGYSELTDKKEQRRRCMAEAKQSGKKLPARFLRALELGLPDCAGCALGVDRLVMILTGAQDIASVWPFAI